MSATKHSVGWDTLNRAAEAEGVEKCLKRIDYRFIRSMTVAAMQSMLVSMHNPKPDKSTIELTNEATLGLAELLFTEWDNSGFTEVFVKLAPLALALNNRARAQLFALEQEMLSPLAIPAEAWSLVWQDFDTKATRFENELKRKRTSFRFADSLDDLERRARDPEDGVYDLEVQGGYRVIGTGVTILPRNLGISPSQVQSQFPSPGPPGSPWSWPPGPTYPWPWPPGSPGSTFPEPDDPFRGTPMIYHYSPFSWRKFFAVAGSIVIGAVNTTAAVPSAGVTVASVATAAAVGGYWAGSGDI